MLEEEQVFLEHFLLSLQIRVGLEQRERLSIAAIRRLNIFLIQPAPNVGNAAVNMRRNGNLLNLLLQLFQFTQPERGPRCLRVRLQHPQKAEIFADVIDYEPEEKAIIESGQLLLFGQLVAGAE